MQVVVDSESRSKCEFRTLYLSFWSNDVTNLAQVCVRASKRSLLIELMDGEHLSVVIHVKSKRRYRSVRELFRLIAEGQIDADGVRGRIGPGVVYFVGETTDGGDGCSLEVVVASGSGFSLLFFAGRDEVERARRVAARVLEVLDGWFKGREPIYKEGL